MSTAVEERTNGVAHRVDQLGDLRKAFPETSVGKLPRVTCKDCSDKRVKCDRHKPSRCKECGAWISEAHIHLDYVGHAEVTDRLLSVDPAWTWEPLAFTPEGLPLFSKGAGGETELWIRLTVCGVTRLGVGSVSAGTFDSEKQLIGDAIRNAAMRFGVALDLWAKEELESQLEPGDGDTTKKAAAPAKKAAAKKQAAPAPAPASTSSTRRPPPGVDPETGEVANEPPSDDEVIPATMPQRAEIQALIDKIPKDQRDAAQAAWNEKGLAKFRDPNFPADQYAKAVAVLTPFATGGDE